MKEQTKTKVKGKKISKKALSKCFFNWMFYAHACYNYERLQGTGFLGAMSPVIDDLYEKDDIEGRRKALQRHTAFFNTEPRMGCAILGLSASMEERIASGEEEFEGDTVQSIKNGLMGPLAGIGDTFVQAILTPLLLSLTIGLAKSGNIIGPIIYVVSFLAIFLVIGNWAFKLGYKKGDEAIMDFIESGVINKVISGAGVMGCMVMGALIAKYVSLTTKIGFTLMTGEFNLQTNVFDAIMPSMLPLILTLVVYKKMDKGFSALKMLLILVFGGTILGLIGII